MFRPTQAENLSASLIDPEAYDASEQQFAASLEPTASQRLNPGLSWKMNRLRAANGTEPEKSLPAAEAMQRKLRRLRCRLPRKPNREQPQDPDAWRREVAERLSHYRARRRTREPRYPSLQLKFETEPSFERSCSRRHARLLPPPCARPRTMCNQPLLPASPWLSRRTIRGSCPPHHGNHRQGHRVCQLQPGAPGAGRTGRTGARPSQNHRSS